MNSKRSSDQTTGDQSIPMTARKILAKPYHRVVIPDEDMYFGQIAEFPGCFCVGDTAAECIVRLDEVAESWLLASIAAGHDIPEPIDDMVRKAQDAAGISLKAKLVKATGKESQ